MFVILDIFEVLTNLQMKKLVFNSNFNAEIRMEIFTHLI